MYKCTGWSTGFIVHQESHCSTLVEVSRKIFKGSKFNAITVNVSFANPFVTSTCLVTFSLKEVPYNGLKGVLKYVISLKIV